MKTMQAWTEPFELRSKDKAIFGHADRNCANGIANPFLA